MNPSLRFLPLAVFLVGLASSLPSLRAEMRTLTDTQGRTLQAELVSSDGDNVTIKRDDGQTFTIPLSTLSESDRAAIKTWADKQASLIPAGSVQLQASRLVFDSTKKSPATGEILTTEHWGYGVMVQNRTSKAITGLRMDCILFVKPGLNPGQTTTAPLRQVASSKKVDAIPAYGTIQLHTNSITVLRVDLAPGFIWAKTGNSLPVADELHGVWLRFYKDDQLVAETCSPEGLSKTQTWTDPKQ